MLVWSRKSVRCSPEDLPEAMNNREKWRERVRDISASGTTWWWWWWCSLKTPRQPTWPRLHSCNACFSLAMVYTHAMLVLHWSRLTPFPFLYSLGIMPMHFCFSGSHFVDFIYSQMYLRTSSAGFISSQGSILHIFHALFLHGRKEGGRGLAGLKECVGTANRGWGDKEDTNKTKD